MIMTTDNTHDDNKSTDNKIDPSRLKQRLDDEDSHRQEWVSPSNKNADDEEDSDTKD